MGHGGNLLPPHHHVSLDFSYKPHTYIHLKKPKFQPHQASKSPPPPPESAFSDPAYLAQAQPALTAKKEEKNTLEVNPSVPHCDYKDMMHRWVPILKNTCASGPRKNTILLGVVVSMSVIRRPTKSHVSGRLVFGSWDLGLLVLSIGSGIYYVSVVKEKEEKMGGCGDIYKQPSH